MSEYVLGPSERTPPPAGPHNMPPPRVFGWQHLLYLVVVIAVGAAIFLLVRKKYAKNDRALSLIFRVCGVILLFFVTINRVSEIFRLHGWYYIFPNSFCGLGSFVLAFALIFGKKDNIVLHFIAYLTMFGGIVNLIYPYYVGQHRLFFYPSTISGLLHHTMCVFIFVLMVYTGYMKPDIKKWYAIPLGLSTFMTVGVFELSMFLPLDPMYDAMNIIVAIVPDTILTWWFVGLGFVLAYAVFMVAWHFANKARNARKQEAAASTLERAADKKM